MGRRPPEAFAALIRTFDLNETYEELRAESGRYFFQSD